MMESQLPDISDRDITDIFERDEGHTFSAQKAARLRFWKSSKSMTTEKVQAKIRTKNRMKDQGRI